MSHGMMVDQISAYPHEANFPWCDGMVDLIELVVIRLPGLYTFENHTVEKYTFENYTFEKYTFEKYTFDKYTFEKYTFEKYTFRK